jgi:hypothetical protein
MGLISCLVMGRILGISCTLFVFLAMSIHIFFSMYFFTLNGMGIVDFFPLAFHLHSINVSLDRLNALIQISYEICIMFLCFFPQVCFIICQVFLCLSMAVGYFSSLAIFAFNKFHL